MSNKIKCSYEDCFRHFKSEEAMRKHKEKDPDHFYCKRCDFDAEDDVSYLIHQIEGSNGKHICCPVCGEEFEGTSGRDLHVQVRHREKQALDCVGCGMKLMGAAAYMAHIGKNECDVITLEDFDRMRAEQQIQKDAWDDALDTTNIIYGDASGLHSGVGSTGEASLMDDNPVDTNNSYQTISDLNSRISPLQPTTTNTSRPSTSKLASSTTGLYVDKYPPLPAQSRVSQSTSKTDNVPSRTNVDLLDFDEQEDATKPPNSEQQTPGVWKSKGTASHRLFPKKKEEKSYPSQSDISGFSGGPRTTLTGATYGSDTQLPSSRDPLPPATRPTNNDPNASFANIQTTKRVMPQSILDPMHFWDDISHCFRCTGKDCRREFDTPEGFKAHLVTGAHVGGKTQCPSCFKRFSTMPDLVRHFESSSRKCRISKTANYNQILREVTAGLLGVEGHMDDGSGEIRYVTTKIEDWKPLQDQDGYW